MIVIYCTIFSCE